jgi:Adaptor complexes medium subunit family
MQQQQQRLLDTRAPLPPPPSLTSTPPAPTTPAPPTPGRYRVSDNINLPFRIVPAVAEEGRARVTIALKCSAQFSHKLFAENVVIKVPVPNNTARCRVKVRRKPAPVALITMI